MKYISLFVLIICSGFGVNAQKPKLDYIAKIPTAFKNCGALYTYDSVALQKKKYILLTDFQNQGLMSIDGRMVKLKLTGSKTKGKYNISVYNGNGYTITVNYHTVSQTKKYDLEAGTIMVTKGSHNINVKIHGQSSCDVSKQEGNSK